MNNEQCTLTDEQLIEKCEKHLFDLLRSGGRSWCLHVPARVNEDVDVLFNELIQRLKGNRGFEKCTLTQKVHDLEKENILLRAELNAYRLRHNDTVNAPTVKRKQP